MAVQVYAAIAMKKPPRILTPRIIADLRAGDTVDSRVDGADAENRRGPPWADALSAPPTCYAACAHGQRLIPASRITFVHLATSDA